MQFTEIPVFDNIKSTNEYLQIGSRFVKNISYVDVENIDLPSEIDPYSVLGGTELHRKQRWIISPSSTNWRTTKPSFTIRSLPFRCRHTAKGTRQKKKKHEGAANNSPSNAIIAEEIQTLLHNIAIDGQLVVNAHFPFCFQQILWKKWKASSR
jgi:hypothetical protein